MGERDLQPLAVIDPREWKRAMLAAAAAGPTTADPATGAFQLLRYHDIEAILHEPRLHGVGLPLFDQMGISDGPLRDWYGLWCHESERNVVFPTVSLLEMFR